MTEFFWIVASGLAMCAIAAIGSSLFLLGKGFLSRITLPLVAFSAGSLIGGAFLHMIPSSLHVDEEPLHTFFLVLAGFSTFLALEQFIHWHHCHHHDSDCAGRPMNHLILIGDGVHNFIGGMAIASAFLQDIHMGLMAFIAAAAHEIPQEFGDLGVLLHGGWARGKAVLFNMISASTFLVGGLLAWSLSGTINVSFLVPFAAGNFIYIGASDLIPEVNKHHTLRGNLLHFVFFLLGLGIMGVTVLAGHQH